MSDDVRLFRNFYKNIRAEQFSFDKEQTFLYLFQFVFNVANVENS